MKPVLQSLTFLFSLLALNAWAGPVLHLQASAASKVANDEMQVTVTAVSSGQNVSNLNEAVVSALNNAVKKARTVPGVKMQLSNIQTHQEWREGRQTGWQVSGELILTSQDMPALAQLSADLGKQLQIRKVSFQLSETKRQAEETRLLKEAADNFRVKAEAAARAFGFNKYEIEELSLNHQQRFPDPIPMMEFAKANVASASPLPTEGGNAEVSVAVAGRVKLD